MSKRIASIRNSPTWHPAAERTVGSASTVPPDSVAVIYRPARSAMTSGTANSRKWKLRFERRSPPFIEPLMGWTGGDDPLAQVDLTFPSEQAAIAYARRQGRACIVHEPKEAEMTRRHRVSNLKPDDRVCRPARFPPRDFIQDTATPTVDNGPSNDDPVQADAATEYASPHELLRDPKRSIEQKRKILCGLALAAYRLDAGVNKQRAPYEQSSQLNEIIDALIDLDETAATPVVVKGGHTTIRIDAGKWAA